MPGRISCCCLLLASAAAGCSAPAVEPDLAASRTEARVPAIVGGVARDSDEEAVGPAALVAQLDDPDPAVRLFAIGALQRLTDRRFGYRWYRDAEGRREAVGAWEAWLAEGPR